MKTHAVMALGALFFLAPVVASAQFDKSNRYLCYVVEKISTSAQIPDLKVRDQFGRNAAKVFKPRYVCNPVSINNKRIPDPKMHLVCYEASTPIRPKPVAVANEFERPQAAQFELADAQLLCVPSEKRVRK